MARYAHMNLALFSLFLDGALVIVGMVIFWQTISLGGLLGRSFRMIAAGLLFLGAVHMLETVLFALFIEETELYEVIHRLLVLVGFVFMLFGVRTLRSIRT